MYYGLNFSSNLGIIKPKTDARREDAGGRLMTEISQPHRQTTTTEVQNTDQTLKLNKTVLTYDLRSLGTLMR